MVEDHSELGLVHQDAGRHGDREEGGRDERDPVKATGSGMPESFANMPVLHSVLHR
jgi:hypothetical protein